jgi:methionyl-tRNA synthetase
MLHHMSSTEYLNYESGKFSKSKGVGVFGTDVMETGIPADVWRFYIFYNRPEKSDFTFTWGDFMDKVNGELIGNLGNLANRTLSFIQRFYDGAIPKGKPDEAFWKEVRALEAQAEAQLERAELRDAFRTAFQIADIANKRFQAAEPWKARTSDPEKAASLLSDLCYVLRDLAVIMHPYMPQAMAKLASFFGLSVGSAAGDKAGMLSWKDLGSLSGVERVADSAVLFQKLEPDAIAELRERYSGSQKERAQRDADAKDAKAKAPAGGQGGAPASAEKKAAAEPKPAPYAELPLEERFKKLVDLRVAEIVKIERHPKADKLYIETLDDGTGIERVIVSGLVPFYKEEELLGKRIILVNNLKPAKLRGTESRGMLLAASVSGAEGKETVEVLSAPWAAPGTRVILPGQDLNAPAEAEIDVDAFFSVPLRALGHDAVVGSLPLQADGRGLRTERVAEGEIG